MHMLYATIFGIDFVLSFYAIAAFIAVGVGLACLILFTKATLVSTEACKIKINDDPELTKEVAGGQTLLLALSSNGIPIPSPCGGKATCKQCRVQILDGANPPLETDKATFTKKQLNEGWRLSCQMKVNHDLSVHVDPHAYGSSSNRLKFCMDSIQKMGHQQKIFGRISTECHFRK